jgi:hypothetical protein
MMDALTIGVVVCLCLVLASVGFTWMKYREGVAMELMGTTMNNIKNKTPAEAMPIVRRAYPGKTIRVFKDSDIIPVQYRKEDAVHLIVDAKGRINGFDRPGGEGWRPDPTTV